MPRRRSRVSIERLAIVLEELKNHRNGDATIRRHVGKLMSVLDPFSLIQLYISIRRTSFVAPYLFKCIVKNLREKLAGAYIGDVIACYFFLKDLIDSGFITRYDMVYSTVLEVLRNRKEEVRAFIFERV